MTQTASPDEIKRLRALRDLMVLDSEPEPFFDSLAKLACEACQTPVAFMSLIDEQRQWFKASVGLPGFNDTARDISFCSHAIMEPELFVVPDASSDPRFESNPMVLGNPAIRFYAGAPLTTSDGARVGMLCVIDRIARELTEEQLSMLSKLAEIASQGLEMRRELITKAIGQRADYEGQLARSESVHRALIPDISKDGEVLGLHGVAVDVTERSKNEKRLRELIAILDNTPDFVAQTDWAGAVTYMNPAARAFCGLSEDASLQGRMFSDFHAPQTQAQFIREAIPVAKQTGSWSGEAWVRGAGGRETLVSHLIIGHKDASGRVERYSAIMRDISEQAQARKAILAQSETLSAVIEAIPALVAVVGSDGRLRLVNRAYERWTQIERQEAIGMPVLDSLRHRDPEGARAWIELALQSETGNYQRIVQTALGERHMAGAYLPLSTPSGAKDGFVIVAQDVTEHKLEEVRLLQLARRDSLTGLLNRSGFAAEAERLIQEGQGSKLALLCIDLDRFKPVNDTHGHPAGDELLRIFAHRLERLVRPTDLVARLGGDEFAILLTGVYEASGGAIVADKVVAAAAEPFEVRGVKLSIGASVGIAHHAEKEGGWIELLVRADAKLYEAKRAGRGRRA